jgi:hypothetical protein
MPVERSSYGAKKTGALLNVTAMMSHLLRALPTLN